MANTADIKNGLCIDHEGHLYQVVEFQHVKPGKGPAFVRTKLKSLIHGRVIDNTWPSGHKIHPINVERRTYQFLYKDEAGFNFMHNETFEQITLSESLIDVPGLYKEGCEAMVLFHADKDQALSCELPNHVVLEITYTEPGIKGDTATNTLKAATLETGAIIRVPLFVNQGDKIKIDTRTSSYIERVKG
jgi:elongation factor P